MDFWLRNINVILPFNSEKHRSFVHLYVFIKQSCPPQHGGAVNTSQHRPKHFVWSEEFFSKRPICCYLGVLLLKTLEVSQLSRLWIVASQWRGWSGHVLAWSSLCFRFINGCFFLRHVLSYDYYLCWMILLCAFRISVFADVNGAICVIFL